MRIFTAFALSGLMIGALGAQDAPAPAPVAKKEKDQLIHVTSSGGAQIHAEKNQMVYIDTVKFNHPAEGLIIHCDLLEVTLTPPPNSILIKASASGDVVVRKRDAKGKLLFATGEQAVFEAKTGATKISGKPAPQLDIGKGFAMTADAVTLDRNGVPRFQGPMRAVFGPRS